MNRIHNHQEGGIADVYDWNDYSSENLKIMEAVANKFMMLIDGGSGSNVLAFDRA